jgi:ATP-binding cassette subfamily F protein 3
LQNLEKKLDFINQQLAERTDYESDSYNQLMIDLNEVQHQFEINGGYNYHGNTERILQGLGFDRKDFDKLTEKFSGGWRMRIELAKLLLQNNDVLLLDEPTNHLDIDSIIWLETFLKNFQGSIVLVSHDKTFLNRMSNRTIEISLGKIYDYNKPYSIYLKLRKERREHQLSAQKNQQKEIERLEGLIDKFKAKATKASMAQSLVKKLEKMDRIEVEAEDNQVMSVNFSISVNPGKVVIEAENISKAYGENQVLQKIDLIIDRGNKIAFIGQNGQGKSTLAKIIIGQLEHQGEMKLGHNVELGYFAQNQADYLNGEKTVRQTMEDVTTAKNRTKVRDILGAFLFPGEEVEKPVKVLSGGERNRLALAKLLLQPFNVLVMDEPTNHLDMQSKNVLKKALLNFEGTLILISHDRDFLQGLSDKTYEFKGGKINEYLGDINFYLEQKKLESFEELEKSAPSKPKKTNKPKPPRDDKKFNKLKNKVSKLEQKITEQEQKIKRLDVELASNYQKKSTEGDFFELYEEAKSKLKELEEKWTSRQMELEEMEN